jgi:5-formyltetrahydrofolate cyclo-ligase
MEHVKQLRRKILTIRTAHPQSYQSHASRQIASSLTRVLAFIRAERIAFYFSTKGEVDPSLIVEKAVSMHKACYFPILHPLKHNKLWFGRYRQGDPLIRNRYGIFEPDLEAVEKIDPLSLDLVITPLVAFDSKGNRLGMGGGFYDRTFAFKKNHYRTKPFLLGLAYDFQEVDNLQANSWDIPLNAVITESRYLPFYKSQTIDP